MDRDELFSLVVAETHRADKLSELPSMLRLAEAKIARELRCEEMSATAVLDTSSGSAALPADFLGLRAAVDANGYPLQQVGLMEYRSVHGNERGFCVSLRELRARVDEVSVEYFARPAAMASGTDTNNVLEAHEDLYCALLSFYVYRRTQDLELAQAALGSYEDARDTLNQLADRQRGAARLGKPYAFVPSAAY